jgi:hypothetical protein
MGVTITNYSYSTVYSYIQFLIGVLGTQYQFLPWLGFIFFPKTLIKYYRTIFGCHSILLATFWYLHTTIFEDTFRPHPKVCLNLLGIGSFTSSYR